MRVMLGQHDMGQHKLTCVIYIRGICDLVISQMTHHTHGSKWYYHNSQLHINQCLFCFILEQAIDEKVSSIEHNSFVNLQIYNNVYVFHNDVIHVSN